jgi:hypothetical protein
MNQDFFQKSIKTSQSSIMIFDQTFSALTLATFQGPNFNLIRI